MAIKITNSISGYEKSIVILILSCIKELEINLGLNKLISILQGAQSSYIYENNFNKNPYYGILQNYNSKQLKNIIDRLFEMNLVENISVDKDFYSNAITLTAKGLGTIHNGKIDKPNFINKIIKINNKNLSKEKLELFGKLRKVRKEIATSMNKPAFIICSDKVLRKVTKEQPQNTDTLLSIKGIGEHFIENYAPLFLNEIQLHTANK